MGFGATCLLNEYEAGAIVLNLFLFCFQFYFIFYKPVLNSGLSVGENFTWTDFSICFHDL